MRKRIMTNFFINWIPDYLLFQVGLSLLYQVNLFVDHVVDALAHGAVTLFPPLSLLMPLMSLLWAKSLAFTTSLHFLLVLKVLFFVVFEVFLNISRNFGQILQLLSYLRVSFIKFIEFHANFVDLNLCSERSAWVPSFNGRSEAASVAISAIDSGSNCSLATLRCLGVLIRH